MAGAAEIGAGDITGIVLAGGRGSRMGGVDKGLQLHLGVPLALHALQRLRLQVGPLMVSANRHLDAYAAFGAPVWPDASADYPGPLAGLLSGLRHCRTPYLAAVPCDTPDFPSDLVARLAGGLFDGDAALAMAATADDDGVAIAQPVFCLMKTQVLGSLQQYLQSGQRQVERWTAGLCCVQVLFDDPAAFANANTAEELRRLQQRDG